MYLNYISRAQWKYFRHLLQMRHMRLLAGKHTNLTARLPLQGVSLPAFAAEGPLQRRLYSFESDDPMDATITRSSSDLDPLLKRLAEAPTIDSVLDVMINNAMQHTHIVEGISILWQHYQGVDQPDRSALTERLLQSILPLLEPHINQLDVDELSRTYLYLRKMHIPNCNPAVEAVLMRALLLVNNQVDKDNPVPLTALSRLSVGINLERDFFTPLVCRNFVHYLENHIAQCRSEEQVRLLSTCLFQLHMIVDEELLNSFKLKVIQLIDENVLSHETPKALLKVIHMLNIPVWSQEHTQLIRKIMLVLEPCIPQLDPGDLKSVCRTFLHHQEPAELASSLKESSEKLLKEEASADALSCLVPFATPLERDKYTQRFRELLHSEEAWLLPNASGHFFSVLRALKIADLKFCNTYWSGVVRELDSCAEEQTHLRFLRHCQRYMNFNNNLGGTYRHFEVEKKLSHMCMSAMEEDISGRLPTKFARLAAFVLAYGHTPFSWKKFPNVLLSKLLAMAPQLDINECFLLSRGMQIACELRFRQHLPSLASMQLATMDNVLISCAERHLARADEEPLSASDLSMIVRTLSHRKSLKNTVVYNKSLSLYKSLHCKDLSSRVVRDMAYNFNASQFLVPELLESMFGYISEQHKHVTGDTVEKVLTCSYNLGYTPTSLEVLEHASEVLIRDFDQMSGLAIVQACLALCFYKSIPEELINRIFCVKFIQRIEDEIQVCYSKATYPERVLNLVMQLNRTVCLDLPEANVPWFQQNYIEAQMSKRPLQSTAFSKDVKELLEKILKDKNHFRCNHTTPYGYQIDFVIHFDRDRKPIPAPPVEATMLDRITKVAILLLRLDSFCENDLTALRGPESLKMKHLEMMGYKVLQINEHDWNSKYMAAPGAKANYLKCLLQISN
ncbi:uncharacterized protein Dana_GF14495, isoform A [Drosophila ananassae]|uniref:Uncharacterized protein, isoform A n=1 Tax=Drosophila ananassae TaxID=7217 RepID=B3MKJ5_DROAN|nr:FAST kinase domain-containing protein 1, mitochondrial isoform X2 [Drosophila ananassae]EDV31548.1 uncharacterized protein Dana_GF14495, isoform A [Drosophila ananassae]